MSMICGIVGLVVSGQMVARVPEFGVLTKMDGRWAGPLRFDDSVGAEKGMVMRLEISRAVGKHYVVIDMDYEMMGQAVSGRQMVGLDRKSGEYSAWGFTNSPLEYPEPRKESVKLTRERAVFGGEMRGMKYSVTLDLVAPGKLEHVTRFGESEISRAVLRRAE